MANAKGRSRNERATFTSAFYNHLPRNQFSLQVRVSLHTQEFQIGGDYLSHIAHEVAAFDHLTGDMMKARIEVGDFPNAAQYFFTFKEIPAARRFQISNFVTSKLRLRFT